MRQKMPEAVKKPEKKGTFLYGVARCLAAFLFHTISPVKYHGLENLHLEAPYIMISNHSSWLDPICVAYAVKHDEVTFLTKKEAMKSKLANAALRKLHAIPVDRHNFDMAAMRACMQALKEGRILGIFPEGTRYKQGIMEELEGGIALLALRGNVPVLPMYIHGKIRPFHKTHCFVGVPLDLSDLKEMGIGKESSDLLLHRITVLYQEMVKSAE